MKYFIDFEFLEGDVPVKLLGYNIPKWLIKPNNTIQPISVGLVCNDGREYYAISKDFNLKEAWNRWQQRTGEGDRNNIEPRLYWIRDNVLKPIFNELVYKFAGEEYKANQINCTVGYNPPMRFTYKNFRKLINKYGKSREQISAEIQYFTLGEYTHIDGEKIISPDRPNIKGNPEFYGYYSDYDWVLFCSLFGRMMDLPKGFPMYCKDLKQMFDEKANSYTSEQLSKIEYPTVSHNVLEYLESSGKIDKPIHLKTHKDYPIQENEHNALDDARWNKKLFDFINGL